MPLTDEGQQSFQSMMSNPKAGKVMSSMMGPMRKKKKRKKYSGSSMSMYPASEDVEGGKGKSGK